MAKSIFRKAALDKLSSPEQLDQLIRITNPMGWIAVFGIGCLLAATLSWGVVGSIPVKVVGEGLLTRSGGVFEIVSETGGRIANVYFEPGDYVREGMMVAQVLQPELEKKISLARLELKELRDRFQMVSDFNQKTLLLQMKRLAQKQESEKAIIKSLDKQSEWLQLRIDDEEVLFKKGLVTEQQILQKQQELDDIRQQIMGHQQQLKQIKVEKVQVKSVNEKELQLLQNQIATGAKELSDDLDDLHRYSRVTSYYTGKVLEIDVNGGDNISAGSVIMKVEQEGENFGGLRGVIYYSAGTGKKIKPGMKAKVAPATVQAEEYGLMVGIVTYVSEFPTSAKAMMTELENESLVESLLQGGSPIEVHLTLIPDPRTPSGFKWTSSKGPPTAIGPGTLAMAIVDIEEKRPLEFVIPLFRKYALGVGQ